MVFAVVMSPETAQLIDPAVRVWQADVRPIDLGTRFTIRGRLGVVPIRGTSEVTIWDPPQLAEFRSIAPTWPFRMTARHRVTGRVLSSGLARNVRVVQSRLSGSGGLCAIVGV